MSTNNIQLKLKKLTLANLILGYIAFSFVAVMLLLFLLALLVKPEAIILLILLSVVVGGVVTALIIANIVLSGFQVHYSKRSKPIGGISKNAVLITMTICDFFALAGVLICVIFAILNNLDNITIDDSTLQKVGAIATPIALAACLAQAIFNTIYYKKLKKSH